MTLFRPSPAKRYGPSLLDQLPVGVSVYRLDRAYDDASLRLVYANAAAGRITGLDLAAELGRPALDVTPRLAETPLLAAYARVARTGTPETLGRVVYGDDRITSRTFRIEAIPLPKRSVGVVFEDATDRSENATLRRDGAALARDEARFRTLVEATAAIVWTTAPDGTFAEDQPGWRAFTGQSRSEHVGEGWLEAVHPDDRKRTAEVLSEAVRTQTPFALTHRVRRADGVYRTMSVRGTPVLDGDRVAEWVGVHSDTEDQDAAAVALAASEARFRTLFDALADPVLVYPLGPDGPEPLVAFNAATVALYGYSADELYRMTVLDLVAPGSPSVLGVLDELRRNRQATFEATHRTRDGRSVPIQTSARLVEYEGRLCVLALARDDSERRAFQRDLGRANLGLERTVDARTAELQAFADALKILHRITTENYATPAERTDAYLRAGCAMFSMPVGILSATPLDPETGGRLYRLEAVVSPDPSLSPGLTAPISEAFCDAVLERGETVAHADAADDPALACHPAYATRGLRAFLGTPIRIAGEIVGTLNFVSPEPRPNGFQPTEKDLIEIMADAVARRLVADEAERQRHHTEDYYRTVVDTVDEGIVTLDREGCVTMSNPSARVLLGLEPETRHAAGARDSGGALVPAAQGTERGGTMLDLAARWPVVGEDGRPFPADRMPEALALATGEPVRGVLQGIVQPDGSVRWYRVNAAPIDHDGDGQPEAVVLSFSDVTSLRAATEDAKRAAGLLASVQAASPDGVMAFRAVRDDAGTLVDFEWLLANPRSTEISGRAGENLIGQRLLAVFPGNVDSGLFDAYRRVTETGEPFRTTLDYLHDGLQATLRVTATPLDIDGAGGPDGFSVVFTDVSATDHLGTYDAAVDAPADARRERPGP